jgi:hypothetical protein
MASFILHHHKLHVLNAALHKYLCIIGYSVQKNTEAKPKDFKTFVAIDHDMYLHPELLANQSKNQSETLGQIDKFTHKISQSQFHSDYKI